MVDTLAYVHPIGYRLDGRPIRQVRGAAPTPVVVTATDDDDPDDPDPDDDPDDDDPDPDEPAADGNGWKPPTKAEWEQQLAKTKVANDEAKRRRQWLEAHGIDPHTGKRPDPEPEPEEPDPQPADGKPNQAAALAARRAAEERGEARAVLKLKPALVRMAAENALRGAGWAGENIGLALKLVEHDLVDVDPATQAVTGLDEQVEAIKAEFPTWFRTKPPEPAPPPRTRRGAGDVDGATRRQPNPRPKTWAESVADQLPGARRR